MKSSKVEVKVNRLGTFSVLGLMLLTLAVGRVYGVEEFKLWHLKNGKPGAALQHLDKDGLKEAKDFLKVDLTQANFSPNLDTFKALAKKWHKEPFQMVEGIRESFNALKSGLDSDKVEKLKSTFRLAFEQLHDEEFDNKPSRRDELIALIKKMFDGRNIDAEDFLKNLFDLDDAQMLALNITATKPEDKKEEDKKEEDKKEDDKKDDKKVGEQEITDEELKAKAQQICDQINGKPQTAVDPRVKQLEDELAALRDQLAKEAQKAKEAADLANELANRAADPRPEHKKDDKDATDAIADLAKMLGEKDEEPQAQPPQSSSQTPPQPKREDNKADDFKQPLPQATPEQPSAGPMIAPMSSAGGTIPVKADLPSNTGTAEINASNMALAKASGASLMSRVIPGNIPYLTLLRDEAQTTKAALTSAMTQAQARIEKLEKDKKALGDGISAASKEQRDRLANDAEKLKKAAEDARTAFNSLSAEQKTPEAAQSVQQAQRAASDKESEWKNYEQSIKRVQDGDVKAAKEEIESNIDKLNANVAELRTKIEKVSKEEEQLNMMIAQGQSGQQQQRPNAFNRITSGGNSATRNAPRTTPSTLGGAMRGPLAGKN